MHEIVERIMLLAAPKKKAERKYTKDAENAFDELMVHFVEGSDYTKNDRAFRLLMRLRKALEAEGYAFREKVMPAGPSSSTSLPKGTSTGKTKHLVYSGATCTLLKAKPPTGLDLKATVKLMEYVGSKQCYQYTIRPCSDDACRKNGVNVSLPKPLTWAKLENYGLTREPIVTNDGRTLMEEFTVDGITAWSLDRQIFYIANPGMCRRWMDGLDRIADDAINR